MSPGEPYSIREYRPSDQAGCLAVFRTNVPRFFHAKELDEFKEFLENLPGPYLVVVDSSGSVVGCGGYAKAQEPGVADLCWGMIRQDLHGEGLGRRLTEARIQEARSDSSLKVMVMHTSQHTTGFYELMGFELTGETPDGYGPGLHRCDMRLSLGEGQGQ